MLNIAHKKNKNLILNANRKLFRLALILARGYLKDDGFDVVFYPEFVDLDFDGRLVTALKLIVEPR